MNQSNIHPNPSIANPIARTSMVFLKCGIRSCGYHVYGNKKSNSFSANAIAGKNIVDGSIVRRELKRNASQDKENG